MTKKTTLIAAGLALMMGCGLAVAQQISDFKTATNSALKNGEAKVLLNDGVAQKLREQMRRPNAKVILHVTTLGPLPQPGCKRLQLHFTSPGSALELVGGGTKDLDVTYGINMCENGLPPAPTKAAPVVLEKESQKQ